MVKLSVFFSVLSVLILGQFSWSQEVPHQVTLPPRLMVQEEQGKSQALGLEAVDTEVVIRGLIAETTMTLTFYNPHPRVLEGQLLFPLPEGSTVCGYGLDIQGVIVEGVIVEKHSARVAFEKEVRKGVDPGLVEWVKGNHFRTRVYPIPAQGRRTILIRYVSALNVQGQEAVYDLPLKFKDLLKSFHLKVRVVQGESRVSIKGTLQDFGFQRIEQEEVAETTLSQVSLMEDLQIVLPQLPRSSWNTVETQQEGESYFVLYDTPVLPQNTFPLSAPQHLGLFWDASLSRKTANLSKEFELLEALCRQWKNFSIDLTVFRNESEAPQHFSIVDGESRSLIQQLKALPYDGGTQFPFSAFFNSSFQQEKRQGTYDFHLIFTDGMENLENPPVFHSELPLYVVTSDSRSHTILLNYLAESSGGAFINLTRISVEKALDLLGKPSFSFLGADYSPDQIEEIFPRTQSQIQGLFSLTGRLLSPTATLTLKYGSENQVLHRVPVTLSRSAPTTTTTTLIARFWAQHKMQELAIFPEKSKKELLELGRRYGLVTPETSLIVLESLDQYVEHNIEPPASLPEMRNQWLAHMDALWEEKNQAKTDKTQYLIELWRQKVAWWEQDFSGWKNQSKKKENPEEPTPSAEFGSASMAVGNDDDSEEDGESVFSEELADPEKNASAAFYDEAPPSASPEDALVGGASGGGDTSEREGRRDANELQKGEASKEASPVEAEISIKAWDPQNPYMNALKSKGSLEEAYQAYLHFQGEYGTSPAFYLDCGNFFFTRQHLVFGKRVLSSILEMDLENPALLRVVAYRLAEAEELDLAIAILEEVLRIRPEEPQSLRDLALLLGRRGEKTISQSPQKALKDFERALDLFVEVLYGHWDRFDEIEGIVLMEWNRLLAVVNRLPAEQSSALRKPALPQELVKLLDLDVRILLTWDADLTDVDLWILEPTGEKAFYGNQLSAIGGRVSRDFTQGYGPEEYNLRRLVPGTYTIQANYYGSSQQSLLGETTVKATIFTHYGRPQEQRRELTFRLGNVQEVVTIGEIKLK
jgi:Ca-activated chloride channel family protein